MTTKTTTATTWMQVGNKHALVGPAGETLGGITPSHEFDLLDKAVGAQLFDAYARQGFLGTYHGFDNARAAVEASYGDVVQ